MSTHKDEYHDNMVAMLELIWGEGYMAPGGPGNVAKLLEGTHPRGKRILDVGCGIGGPDFEIARTYGANVIGIDLEAPLIERARAAAIRHGLQDKCEFVTVTSGRLPFDDDLFDIVLTSGALTQTSHSEDLVKDCARVIKPGGFMTCYEWMRTEQEYSEDMLYWIKMEELTFDMRTLDQFQSMFEAAGFVDIETVDASDWYRAESRREYELIKGDLYPRMVELLGRESADHFVEDWRSMVVVCESGEMRQGYCRGRKPL